jgi:hypothetical protein
MIDEAGEQLTQLQARGTPTTFGVRSLAYESGLIRSGNKGAEYVYSFVLWSDSDWKGK